MLNITDAIQSLTTFRRRSGDFIKKLRRTKRPMILTVNGKAAAIVQDAYQRLLDIVARADREEGVRQGLEDAKQGRPDRQEVFSATSKPSMAYLVNITARAARDFAQLYNQINAESSDAALKWYRGLGRRFSAWKNTYGSR